VFHATIEGLWGPGTPKCFNRRAGAVAQGRNLPEPDTDQVELRDVAEERRALAVARLRRGRDSQTTHRVAIGGHDQRRSAASAVPAPSRGRPLGSVEPRDVEGRLLDRPSTETVAVGLLAPRRAVTALDVADRSVGEDGSPVRHPARRHHQGDDHQATPRPTPRPSRFPAGCNVPCTARSARPKAGGCPTRRYPLRNAESHPRGARIHIDRTERWGRVLKSGTKWATVAPSKRPEWRGSSHSATPVSNLRGDHELWRFGAITSTRWTRRTG
jgi:hypothetical protein